MTGHFRVRWRAGACLSVMAVLTAAVYLRPGILSGKESLFGIDYRELHKSRLEFAQDNLFGPQHNLPAWYPRELLGAPYAANLQSFPWIPTRLLLLLFDSEVAYAPGVAMAALLAALFTYLFCRRAGLSEIAAAAAGWTFACAGYFSSRVIAGHLPLMEAYPALPLLLWLADRALERPKRWDLVWLAVASACVMLAGHPQVPVYALAATFAYILWRGRGWLRIRLAGVVIAGSSLALAAWWPMLLLIRKSTRVLPLDPADNDIAFPYHRLWALLDPGIDGWPLGVSRAAGNPFTHSGYPNSAYFFDTAAFVGIAPLVAVVVLLVLCCFRKRLPGSRWMFLACLGGAAFLGALPLLDFLRHLSPALILRSPARLMYLSTFSLAVVLGAAVDEVLSFKRPLAYAAVAVGLSLHVVNLGSISQLFVVTVPRLEEVVDLHNPIFAGANPDSRMALDGSLWSSRRVVDDISTFDSLLLAKPYRAVLALNGDPPRLNEQLLNGTLLAEPALRAGGVAFVVTSRTRNDLTPIGRLSGLNVYSVRDPAPRASFYATQEVVFLPEDEILAVLRSEGFVKTRLLLPPESRSSAPDSAPSRGADAHLKA